MSEEQVLRLIQLLKAMRARPGMYTGRGYEPEKMVLILWGMELCQGVMGNDRSVYREVVAQRGWKFAPIGLLPEMREAGLSDKAIIDELITIEIEALKKAFNLTDVLDNLRREIAAFKKWAALADRGPSWEVDYLLWDDIYEAVNQNIEEVPLKDWTDETYDLLFYALARDHEDGFVLESLKNHPEHLVALIPKALRYEDYEVRWQIVYGLSEVKELKDVAVGLIGQFLADEHEYVRRRASAALDYLREDETSN